MTGLLSLVSQKFYEQLSIRIITGIFASLAAVLPAIQIGRLIVTGLVRLWLYVLELLRIADRSDIIGFHWYIPSKHKWGFWKERAVTDLSFGFGIAAIVFGLLGAFYCDWILAAIAGNWGGFPSSDIAVLYWTYFAAKRLPMLST
ncbi:hypothetical protein NA56DRAFT_663393 [Hyaloscypha hepaticicola]|uniref:Uncharacterized protein n=1 Tax=Hyaloscypha hepaticicola TaxID=2082293 RepID=A0A2J6PQ68_9HELO|nr:hypothetical protein NA56DRAFT_663393 [Hyaloscypha hepaticicola]